jgi:hypothetical protein
MPMVDKDGAAVRKERIQKITQEVLKSLQNCKELSLSKTLAELEYNIGLTKPKILEYLQVATDAGRFILDIDNDKIKPTAAD